MADIGEFAKQGADRFLESQQGIQERFNLNLPRRAVEEFIKTVFYASMIPDEGRYPSACLMSYRKGTERAFHFLFNDRLQPSPQEIAKLARATAPESHICCICDDGRILLGGIHVTALNEMREFGYSSFRVANPLKLLIRLTSSACPTRLQTWVRLESTSRTPLRCCRTGRLCCLRSQA
jgi:hypothetical protein